MEVARVRLANREVGYRALAAKSRRAPSGRFRCLLQLLVKMSIWNHPDLKALSGHHLKGLYELRWKGVGGVPHRVGGYFSAPNEFVMLIGWTHKGNIYDPPSVFDSITNRRKKLSTGVARTREYNIFTGH